MPSIGPLELIVVLVIALLVIGPKKLPGAARSLGSGLRGFKDSLSGMVSDDEPVAQIDKPIAADREPQRAAA
jgi:sec-independent protein translocase protein TatA